MRRRPPCRRSRRNARLVPLFADLDRKEIEQIARLLKERRFAAGETVVMEGSGGAAFFLIDSGEATVSIRGAEQSTLQRGDYFGEIALIDEGPRAATITASDRTRLLRTDVLGVSSAGAGERHHRLEAVAVDGQAS